MKKFKINWKPRYIPFTIIDLLGKLSGLSLISCSLKSLAKKGVVISKFGAVLTFVFISIIIFSYYKKLGNQDQEFGIQLLSNSPITDLAEGLIFLMGLLTTICSFIPLFTKGHSLSNAMKNVVEVDRKFDKYGINVDRKTWKQLFYIFGFLVFCLTLFTISIVVTFQTTQKYFNAQISDIYRWITFYSGVFYVALVTCQFLIFCFIIRIRLMCLYDLISSLAVGH